MSRAAYHERRAYLLTALCTVIFVATEVNPLTEMLSAGAIGCFDQIWRRCGAESPVRLVGRGSFVAWAIRVSGRSRVRRSFVVRWGC